MDQAETRGAPRSGRRRTDPHEARILVVDDDPAIREILVETLETRGGYEVLQAAAGLKALATAWQHAVALIVLDVMLPGMSGVQVAVALKAEESTRDVPILLLTASIDGAADGLAAGADAYLRKPFDLPDLLDRVAALLARTAPAQEED